MKNISVYNFKDKFHLVTESSIGLIHSKFSKCNIVGSVMSGHLLFCLLDNNKHILMIVDVVKKISHFRYYYY